MVVLRAHVSVLVEQKLDDGLKVLVNRVMQRAEAGAARGGEELITPGESTKGLSYKGVHSYVMILKPSAFVFAALVQTADQCEYLPRTNTEQVRSPPPVS